MSTMRECRDLHKLAVELVPRRQSACHALRRVDGLEEGLEAAFCNHVALIREEGQYFVGGRVGFRTFNNASNCLFLSGSGRAVARASRALSRGQQGK